MMFPLAGACSRHLASRAAWFLQRIQAGSPPGRNFRKRCPHVLGQHGDRTIGARESFCMIRTGLAVGAPAAVLTGFAVAQQAPPAAPPPVDFSKVEIKTTDL